MKKIAILLAIVLTTSTLASAQKYVTKSGTIMFYSDTPVEKIEASNRQVYYA